VVDRVVWRARDVSTHRVQSPQNNCQNQIHSAVETMFDKALR
jgi:hypothetical protein